MSLLSPARPSQASIPSTSRRWAGAFCLVALFLTMLATSLGDPLDDSAPVRQQLSVMASNQGTVQRLAWLELLSAVLFFGVVMTLVGLTRRRATGLGNAGGLIGACGAVGLAMISVHHFFLLALLTSDHSTAVAVSHRLDALVGPALLPLLFAGPISLVLLCAAVVRAGLVPWACFVGALVFAFVDMVPGLPDAELIQMLVGLATFGWIGVQMVRVAPAPAAGPTAAEPLLEIG